MPVAYSISISTLHSWRRRSARHGTLQPKQRVYSGRRPKFFHPEPILACLQDNPDYRVQELADHFDLKYSTMHSYLQRFKIKLKKKIYTYKEACPEQRELFLKEVEAIPLEDRVYLDESSIDESLVEARAYALRGQKIYTTRCGHRKKFNKKTFLWHLFFMKEP